MAFWQFTDYITEDNQWPFNNWWKTLHPRIQNGIDVVIQNLGKLETWDDVEVSERKYEVLTGEHAGICELKLKAMNRKVRPFGIMFEDRKEFMLICGGIEHGHGYVPKDALENALKLKAAFEQGKGGPRGHV